MARRMARTDRARLSGMFGMALSISVLAGCLYAYQVSRSKAAACGTLRGAILSVLERDIDAQAKRGLLHRDLAQFERDCALSDPGAKEVFAALDRVLLFTGDGGPLSDRRPVRFMAPPPPPPPPRLDGRPGERRLGPPRTFERRSERALGT